MCIRDRSRVDLLPMLPYSALQNLVATSNFETPLTPTVSVKDVTNDKSSLVTTNIGKIKLTSMDQISLHFRKGVLKTNIQTLKKMLIKKSLETYLFQQNC